MPVSRLLPSAGSHPNATRDPTHQIRTAYTIPSMRPLRRAPAPGTGKEGSAGDEDAPTDASVPAPSAVGVAEAHTSQGWNGLEADLLDQVQTALAATDVEGRITHWNRRAEVLFGWPAEEALGRDFRELLVAPGKLDAANAIREQVLSGSTWEGELPIPRKDGRPIPSYTTLSPIRDEAGKVSGIVSVSVDISDRVRQERLLAARTAVTRVLAEAIALAEATPPLMAAVCESLGWEVGALWRVDESAARLRCVDIWHPPDKAALDVE